MKKRSIWYCEGIVDAIKLAKIGRSNRAIQEQTGLTACQVTYRLTKAKHEEGLPKGIGYRVAWRDGTSPEAQRFDRLFLGSVARKTRQLLKKFRAAEAAK